MLRVIALLPLLFAGSAAQAQPIPEDAHKAIWCGLAFQIFFVDTHRNDVVEIEVFQPYADAAEILFEHGRRSLAAAGFDDAAASGVREDLVAIVTRQVNKEEPAEFAAPECAALAKTHGYVSPPEAVS